jgi:cytochrome c
MERFLRKISPKNAMTRPPKMQPMHKMSHRIFALCFSFGLACVATNAVAAGDAAKGADIMKNQCQFCHVWDKGAKPTLGPNLFGIVGRKAGTANFDYSSAMKQSGIVWSHDALKAYITAPNQEVPGTKMAIDGLSKADAEDVIAYLSTLH